MEQRAAPVRITNEAGVWLVWLYSRPDPDRHVLSFIAKGTYAVVPDRAAALLDLADQPPPTGERFRGDDPAASCLYDGDFQPYKPVTDLTLDATCFAPGGRPAESVTVRFGLRDRLKTLRVWGDRRWRRNGIGTHHPGDSEPFLALPIAYEHAYGGPGFAHNPVGIGAAELIDAGGQLFRPVPNIEDPRQPLRDPREAVFPAGYGPLARGWAERRARVGTYGEDYLETRWPSVAADFDWGFYNSAPPDQRVEGYLRGDEVLYAENLHPEHPRLVFALPGLRMRCLVQERHDDGSQLREVAMRLDTAHVDLHAFTVTLVWRGLLGVSSEQYPELERVYLGAEAADQPPLAVEEHQRRFAAAVARDEAPPVEEAPPPDPPPPEPEAEPPQVAELRRQAEEQLAEAVKLLERAKVPPAVLDRLRSEKDPAVFVQELTKALGVSEEQVAGIEAEQKARMKKLLADQGYDASLVDQIERPPAPAPEPAEAPGPLTRAEVLARRDRGESLANADMAGLDLAGERLAGLDMAGAILAKARLAGCDLSGAVLTGATLAEADLAGARLERAVLDDADLTGAVLAGARLDGASLTSALFERADLTEATLVAAQGDYALFVGAMLADAVAERAVLRRATFDRARLDGVRFDGANLAEASVEGAIGAGASMNGADLTRLRASEGTRFPDGSFVECRADHSMWVGADLRRASFAHCSLTRADFTGADLRRANLQAADLTLGILVGARLQEARLVVAKLFRASLEKATMTGADLRGSSLFQAELLDAEVTGVRWQAADLGMTRLAHLDTAGPP